MAFEGDKSLGILLCLALVPRRIQPNATTGQGSDVGVSARRLDGEDLSTADAGVASAGFDEPFLAPLVAGLVAA